jgi:peptide/nickel transport system substrate-binding protein
VNSYDVQYTLELFKKIKQFKNSDMILDNIKEFKVVDSSNCSISFNNPVAEPLYFTNFPILPAENNYDTTNISSLKESYYKKFIGCGPFLISYYSEDSLTLTKNNSYPDRLPYLQKVTFLNYELFDQLQIAMLDKTIDFVQNLPVEASAIPDILKTFNIDTYPEKGYTFIAWNLNSDILQNKNMRLALSHAIDRQTLIDGIFAGYAETINGPIYFNKNNEKETLNHPEFNMQKAERLLTEIGWGRFDQQGYRMKNGRRLTLDMLVNKENTERIEIAKNIRSNLNSVGVDLKLKFVSWKELLRSIQFKQFDATLVTWTDNDYYDPTLLFHSKAINNGLNFMSYKSAIVDSLIDRALYSWDKNQKAEYWRQFREQVVMDLPCTFLFSQKIIVAYNKKIQNIQLDRRGYLANIKEWWIE